MTREYTEEEENIRIRKAGLPPSEDWQLPKFGAKSQLECDDMKAAMDTAEELKKRVSNAN